MGVKLYTRILSRMIHSRFTITYHILSHIIRPGKGGEGGGGWGVALFSDVDM